MKITKNMWIAGALGSAALVLTGCATAPDSNEAFNSMMKRSFTSAACEDRRRRHDASRVCDR